MYAYDRELRLCVLTTNSCTAGFLLELLFLALTMTFISSSDIRASPSSSYFFLLTFLFERRFCKHSECCFMFMLGFFFSMIRHSYTTTQKSLLFTRAAFLWLRNYNQMVYISKMYIFQTVDWICFKIHVFFWDGKAEFSWSFTYLSYVLICS